MTAQRNNQPLFGTHLVDRRHPRSVQAGLNLLAGLALAFSSLMSSSCGGSSTPTSPSAASAPTPVVSAISPSAGVIGGGTAVTITGTDFQPGAVVTIGGTATGVSVVSSTSITATTPANTPGAVDVVVTNPGNRSGRLSAAFTYACLAAPTGLLTTYTTSGGSLILFVLWDAVPNATSYVFEMGTAPGTTSFTRDVLPSSTAGPGILVGAGTNAFTFVRGTSYYIRVRAKNECGIGLTSIELQRNYV